MSWITAHNVAHGQRLNCFKARMDSRYIIIPVKRYTGANQPFLEEAKQLGGIQHLVQPYLLLDSKACKSTCRFPDRPFDWVQSISSVCNVCCAYVLAR